MGWAHNLSHVWGGYPFLTFIHLQANTPPLTELRYNIVMNNIVSFKSELVSKVIDAIFNTDLTFSEVTQLSNVSNEFDFFSEVQKTAEKVVGDFIIKNFKFIKEGRIIYSPEGLATKVMDLLWNKHAW